MKAHKKAAVLIAAVLGILLFQTGCGKKGPPITPGRISLPAVSDLASVVEADTAVLEWSVPETKEKKDHAVAGFVIFEARNPVAESACGNCPVRFKPIAEVMAEPGKSGKKMKYSARIEKGFRYFFKVVAFGEKTESEGRDSNVVEFVY
jgi:hypothetical protein